LIKLFSQKNFDVKLVSHYLLPSLFNNQLKKTNMEPRNQMQKPFFAKFMEGQANAQTNDGQQTFWPTDKFQDSDDQTNKFPSDSDEEI